MFVFSQSLLFCVVYTDLGGYLLWHLHILPRISVATEPMCVQCSLYLCGCAENPQCYRPMIENQQLQFTVYLLYKFYKFLLSIGIDYFLRKRKSCYIRVICIQRLYRASSFTLLTHLKHCLRDSKTFLCDRRYADPRVAAAHAD